MNSFITLPYNDIVKNHIIKYSEKMPQTIGKILGLCEYYMPQFEEIFSLYDMPEELKAMAVIESAMNPLADPSPLTGGISLSSRQGVDSCSPLCVCA